MRGQELVDREEVAVVRRAMEEGERLFAIGPRRCGKTSILRTAEQAPGEGGVGEDVPDNVQRLARACWSAARDEAGQGGGLFKGSARTNAEAPLDLTHTRTPCPL